MAAGTPTTDCSAISALSVASAEASSADGYGAVFSNSRTFLGEVCIEAGICSGVAHRLHSGDCVRRRGWSNFSAQLTSESSGRNGSIFALTILGSLGDRFAC